ncbi:hypothetical protein KO561_06470 [Radiobacillus kanasensis]|nr:hypothetical protein [Radiobacillus kanasensis]UFU00580.1 hypothetical protein KO561_06470 [Radiobacillus kanasensis]
MKFKVIITLSLYKLSMDDSIRATMVQAAPTAWFHQVFFTGLFEHPL